MTSDDRTITVGPIAEDLEESFDGWWQIWPRERRIGKAPTRNEYLRLRRAGVDRDTLDYGLVGWVLKWRKDGTEPKYIPHPERFLKKRRWEDECIQPEPEPSKPTEPFVPEALPRHYPCLAPESQRHVHTCLCPRCPYCGAGSFERCGYHDL